MKTVLVVAAHPDDEALGCGGAIARHALDQDEVYVVFLSDGVTSRVGCDSNHHDARIHSRNEALKILGAHHYSSFGFDDNQLDSVPLLDVVAKLEVVLRELRPTIVYTHHHGDLNIDHKVACSAVMTACRPLPTSTIEEIYGFEVLSSTEWGVPQQSYFKPNMYIDISDYMDAKLNALRAYKDEMRMIPHSRSIEHARILAEHRGYSVGVTAAEAFEVYRIIR